MASHWNRVVAIADSGFKAEGGEKRPNKLGRAIAASVLTVALGALTGGVANAADGVTGGVDDYSTNHYDPCNFEWWTPCTTH